MPTGYFGKVPSRGDFVASRLAPGVQGVLDRWLTQWLAPHAEMAGLWPDRGLRACIETPGGALALLVLPSHDAVGRSFPLAAVAPLGGAGQRAVDAWAEAALFPLDAAVAGEITLETLAATLADLADPTATGPSLRPPVVWAMGGDALPPEASLPGLVRG